MKEFIHLEDIVWKKYQKGHQSVLSERLSYNILMKK